MTAKALYGTALVLTLVSFFLVPGKPVRAAECHEIGGAVCTAVCSGFWIWKKNCKAKSYWDLI